MGPESQEHLGYKYDSMLVNMLPYRSRSIVLESKLGNFHLFPSEDISPRRFCDLQAGTLLMSVSQHHTHLDTLTFPGGSRLHSQGSPAAVTPTPSAVWSCSTVHVGTMRESILKTVSHEYHEGLITISLSHFRCFPKRTPVSHTRRLGAGKGWALWAPQAVGQGGERESGFRTSVT